MGRLTKDELNYVLSKYNSDISTIIETGTCEGGFSIIASGVFKNVITIELNNIYYEKAVSNCSNIKNIELILGNSTEELPKLINTKESLAFYLDAHYFNNNNAEVPLIPKSEFPLWRELEIICARNKHDIIMIDDVHTFGRERLELRYNDKPDWELVTTENILNAIGFVIDSEIIGDCFVIWR